MRRRVTSLLPLAGAALLGAGISIAVATTAQAGPCDPPSNFDACSACIQANFHHTSVCVDAGTAPQSPSLFPECDGYTSPTEQALCNDRRLIGG